jgi:hypothetical protein
MFLKPPIMLAASPRLAWSLMRQPRALVGLILPIAAIAGIYLAMNIILFKGASRSSVGFRLVNPMRTLGGVLFSEKGLISFRQSRCSRLPTGWCMQDEGTHGEYCRSWAGFFILRSLPSLTNGMEAIVLV